MGVKQYRPTSPGRRFQTVSDKAEITCDKPEKSLLAPLNKKAGRNNHGHITVNGKTVDIPSYQVKPGDVIAVKENKKENALFKELRGAKIVMPKWVEFDTENFTGKILDNPKREDIDLNINEQLIIELYSK